uniref:Uncharacterized protein n=1 Tax=Anopheles minimus TaxID=112268 RepID=A0A182VT99_9DIPT
MSVGVLGTHVKSQRRNYREANWHCFESYMDEHLDATLPLETAEDIDTALSSFNSGDAVMLRGTVEIAQRKEPYKYDPEAFDPISYDPMK